MPIEKIKSVRTVPVPRARQGGRRAVSREAAQPPVAQVGATQKSGVTGRNTPALGRTRVRKADSPKRAPLSAPTAGTLARTAQRGSPATTPAFIHSPGVPLDADDRAYLRRKLGRRLGKFVPNVQRVSVRFKDTNGPRGGVDKYCRIKVTLRDLPAVVVEAKAPSTQAAMDRALKKLGPAVTRPLQQRVTRVRRPSERARSAPVSG